MRILQALAGAHHGGAELFFERLVPALTASGVEQRVLIRRDERRAAILAAAGVTDVHQLAFGNRLDLATRLAFRAQVRDFSPDIVFTWMNRASIIAPKSPLGDTKFIRVARLGGYYNLKYYRGCDYLIGDTDAIVDYLTANGWPAERAIHLPNFVADTKGVALPRSDFFVPEGAPLILALGRLHENKGFDILLHSLVDLPGTYLLLAGTGPQDVDLEELAVKLGVRPRVRLLGWREDVPDLLATVDLFVHPARHEPLGNVILEAWAQDCPVVATAAEGPSVLIDSSVSGLLTPVGDASALADAIRTLLSDPLRRKALAAGGHQAYERNFTQSVVVSAYRSFFERILG
jgi:glycosyltransferase involved in cell wall biosynthesis